jgi:nucleotide-binding universal stress UspA family protein
MIQPVCEEGVLHERIVARAEVGSRDLIIMGTKGHGVLDRTIAGSVTRRVIEYSSKDILVVPAEAKVAWDRILLATDGSPNSRAAATRALDLARTYGSELKVLSVINIPESIDGQAEDLAPALYHIHRDNVAEITGQAAGRALKAEGLVGVGRPAQVITQMARELQADLIIMGSHGRTGIKRLLLGSVTEKVIGQAPCPVLVVKGEELG